MRSALLALIVVCLTASAWGATYVVKANGNGDFPTIQAAIDAAMDGDVIVLKNGIYRGDGNRDVNTLGKAITVRAQSGNPKNCIIDCEGTPEDPHRGFRIDSGEGLDTVIEGITITGGFAPMAVSIPAGGAILVTGHYDPEVFWTSATIRNCRFIDNLTPYAVGGVDFFFSNSVIEDCYFEGNRAPDGPVGAMVAAGHSHVTATNCTFIDNSSTGVAGAIGGGFFVGDTTVLTLVECSFTGNHAGDNGGALGNGYGTTIIAERCMFVDNWTDSSGGVHVSGGGASARFSECTFANNMAMETGGAIVLILNDDGVGHAEIENCTFYGNSAPDGSTLAAQDESSYLITNSILAFGVGGAACTGTDVYSLACADIYGNEGGDWTGVIADQLGVDGNISLDPRLVNPENGIFLLKGNSPCVPFSPPNEECDLIGAWSVGNGHGHDDLLMQETQELRGNLLSALARAGGTEVRYSIAEPGQVSIAIYDINGRLTRHLVDKVVPAGLHDVLWDGNNDAGQPVSTGIYFSQLRVNGRDVDSRKILIVK